MSDQVNQLDESIDRYLSIDLVSRPIPKYYGHPSLIGAFSVIIRTSEGMQNALRGLVDGYTSSHIGS